MQKPLNKVEKSENVEKAKELKPFFFPTLDRTIMAESQADAEKILADEKEEASK